MIGVTRPATVGASIPSRSGHASDDFALSARPRRLLAMNQTKTVAVLGSGIMGAPMARNLAAAGMQVRAWNRTPEKARALAGDGVAPADAPAEAVRDTDAVVTMLADGPAVE